VATCRDCGGALPSTARFCASCGTPVAGDPTDLPTFSSPIAPRPPSSGSGTRPPSSQAPADGGRFLPGVVLAARYRIVERLGKGGMGEVYRADDLTLGQPVALKFLPPATNTEEMIGRLRAEVRIARRVSHLNVCRVYDIGEAEGLCFLSMEYVDGEDLAALLKRIGRLPPDKALDVAHQICAGLAAAHEKGVLHRDLKPANVMLDGRGQVLITDFGLAALADQVAPDDVRSGTPAYMAPEQLLGQDVTIQSDVYALGLVLYEVFTGKRAFDSKTLAEALRARTESSPTNPSDLVADLDPAVERTILRCLETDPVHRPPSVPAVAAALPGGDPLAAALAAGETPAPHVVAGAGQTTGFAPREAVACLAAAVLGLASILYLGLRTNRIDAVGLEAPDVLAQAARDTLARLGYSGTPTDSAAGFDDDGDYLKYLESSGRHDHEAFLAGRPSPVFYWYRVSPRPMVVLDFMDLLLTPGIVTQQDPPTTLSGMVNLTLDARGRLRSLQAVPPEREAAPVTAAVPDWSPVLMEAGLDAARLKPAAPEWISLAATDTRAAWTGTWPGTDRPLRVEAGAFHGRVVFFDMVGPWTKPHRMSAPESSGERYQSILTMLLSLLVLVGSAILARHNHVRGRVDRRGAARLASFVFCVSLSVWVLRGHHVPSVATFGILVIALAHSLFHAAAMWVLYLSLEPYVRRRWPQTIISWSRLVAGRVRDPLVGRDLLSGVLLGLLWSLIFEVSLMALQRAGSPPEMGSWEYLLGTRWALGTWLAHLMYSIQSTLVFFFVLFLLRVLLRRGWLAGVAFTAIFATTKLLGAQHLTIQVPAMITIYAIAAFAVLRFGLVALAAGILTIDLLLNAPMTVNTSNWYAASTVFIFLSILVLASWAFYVSLGGQRLLKEDLFD
jgi:predicted Ser/Thr protein kinase